MGFSIGIERIFSIMTQALENQEGACLNSSNIRHGCKVTDAKRFALTKFRALRVWRIKRVFHQQSVREKIHLLKPRP